MSQERKYSAIESAVNVVSGLFVSFLIQIWIYPLLKIPVTTGQNIIITAVFVSASFVRGYVIRRIFNTVTKQK